MQLKETFMDTLLTSFDVTKILPEESRIGGHLFDPPYKENQQSYFEQLKEIKCNSGFLLNTEKQGLENENPPILYLTSTDGTKIPFSGRSDNSKQELRGTDLEKFLEALRDKDISIYALLQQKSIDYNLDIILKSTIRVYFIDKKNSFPNYIDTIFSTYVLNFIEIIKKQIANFAYSSFTKEEFELSIKNWMKQESTIKLFADAEKFIEITNEQFRGIKENNKGELQLEEEQVANVALFEKIANSHNFATNTSLVSHFVAKNAFLTKAKHAIQTTQTKPSRFDSMFGTKQYVEYKAAEKFLAQLSADEQQELFGQKPIKEEFKPIEDLIQRSFKTSEVIDSLFGYQHNPLNFLIDDLFDNPHKKDATMYLNMLKNIRCNDAYTLTQALEDETETLYLEFGDTRIPFSDREIRQHEFRGRILEDFLNAEKDSSSSLYEYLSSKALYQNILNSVSLQLGSIYGIYSVDMGFPYEMRNFYQNKLAHSLTLEIMSLMEVHKNQETFKKEFRSLIDKSALMEEFKTFLTILKTLSSDKVSLTILINKAEEVEENHPEKSYISHFIEAYNNTYLPQDSMVNEIIKKSEKPDYIQAVKELKGPPDLFIDDGAKIDKTASKENVLGLYNTIENKEIAIHLALNNHQNGLYGGSNYLRSFLQGEIFKQQPKDGNFLSIELQEKMTQVTASKEVIYIKQQEDGSCRYTVSAKNIEDNNEFYSISFDIVHDPKTHTITHKNFKFSVSPLAQDLGLSEAMLNAMAKGKETSYPEIDLTQQKEIARLFKEDLYAKILAGNKLSPSEISLLHKAVKPIYNPEKSAGTISFRPGEFNSAEPETQFLVFYANLVSPPQGKTKLAIGVHEQQRKLPSALRVKVLTTALQAEIVFNKNNPNNKSNLTIDLIIKDLQKRPSFFGRQGKHETAVKAIQNLSAEKLLTLIEQRPQDAEILIRTAFAVSSKDKHNFDDAAFANNDTVKAIISKIKAHKPGDIATALNTKAAVQYKNACALENKYPRVPLVDMGGRIPVDDNIKTDVEEIDRLISEVETRIKAEPVIGEAPIPDAFLDQTQGTQYQPPGIKT